MIDNDPRLDKIRQTLNEKKAKDDAIQKSHQAKYEDKESMSTGLRAGAELITAIAAGAFIGYWLDNWLGTKPLFLIAMLILGVITGFVNVWRTTQNIGHAVGYRDITINEDETKKDDG